MIVRSGLFSRSLPLQTKCELSINFDSLNSDDLIFKVGLSGQSGSSFFHVSGGVVFDNNNNFIYSIVENYPSSFKIINDSVNSFYYCNEELLSFSDSSNKNFQHFFFETNKDLNCNVSISGQVPELSFLKVNDFSGSGVDTLTGYIINSNTGTNFQITGMNVSNTSSYYVSEFNSGIVSNSGIVKIKNSISGALYERTPITLSLRTNFGNQFVSIDNNPYNDVEVIDTINFLPELDSNIPFNSTKSFDIISYYNYPNSNRNMSISLEKVSGGIPIPIYNYIATTGSGNLVPQTVIGSGNPTGIFSGQISGTGFSIETGIPYVVTGNLNFDENIDFTGRLNNRIISLRNTPWNYSVSLNSGNSGTVPLSGIIYNKSPSFYRNATQLNYYKYESEGPFTYYNTGTEMDTNYYKDIFYYTGLCDLQSVFGSGNGSLALSYKNMGGPIHTFYNNVPIYIEELTVYENSGGAPNRETFPRLSLTNPSFIMPFGFTQIITFSGFTTWVYSGIYSGLDFTGASFNPFSNILYTGQNSGCLIAIKTYGTGETPNAGLANQGFYEILWSGYSFQESGFADNWIALSGRRPNNSGIYVSGFNNDDIYVIKRTFSGSFNESGSGMTDLDFQFRLPNTILDFSGIILDRYEIKNLSGVTTFLSQNPTGARPIRILDKNPTSYREVSLSDYPPYKSSCYNSRVTNLFNSGTDLRGVHHLTFKIEGNYSATIPIISGMQDLIVKLKRYVGDNSTGGFLATGYNYRTFGPITENVSGEYFYPIKSGERQPYEESAFSSYYNLKTGRSNLSFIDFKKNSLFNSTGFINSGNFIRVIPSIFRKNYIEIVNTATGLSGLNIAKLKYNDGFNSGEIMITGESEIV